VLVAHVARAAELEVPQQEALLPGVEWLEVHEAFEILPAVERLEAVALRVEGAQGVFDPLVGQDPPEHQAEAAVGLEVDGEKGIPSSCVIPARPKENSPSLVARWMPPSSKS
jgi:hypothetical protein